MQVCQHCNGTGNRLFKMGRYKFSVICKHTDQIPLPLEGEHTMSSNTNMRSPMIKRLRIGEEEEKRYSDLQILQSGGGYYIGTMYRNEDDPKHPFDEPGTRDTGYYLKREDAEKDFERIKNGEAPLIEGGFRMTP